MKWQELETHITSSIPKSFHIPISLNTLRSFASELSHGQSDRQTKKQIGILENGKSYPRDRHSRVGVGKDHICYELSNNAFAGCNLCKAREVNVNMVQCNRTRWTVHRRTGWRSWWQDLWCSSVVVRWRPVRSKADIHQLCTVHNIPPSTTEMFRVH